MSVQITVTLPDEIYQRVERLARLTGRELAEVLSVTLQASFYPLDLPEIIRQNFETMPDDEILILSELQMDANQDKRLSELLEKRHDGELTHTEQNEFQALMQINQEGLLRKAWALAEAVRRGLREPLEP